MHNAAGGMCLLIVAGIMNASFALPMKYVRAWAWENTWLLWSAFALLLLPCALAFATIPAFGALLAAAGGVVLIVAACGAAWGVAQVLFGLALDKIGIALTFSIVLGLSAAMGGLVPLVRLHRDRLLTHAGVVSMLGIALVLVGVAVSAVAGRMRDRSQRNEASTQHFGVGLFMAIASGICASMMNVGFSFGTPLSTMAAMHHANTLWCTDAIWVPLMAGGAIPNLLYCAYLLRKRKTSRNYTAAAAGKNVPLALAMAVLWFGSSILYGIATAYLGDLGPVIGWPLFMSLIVIVASVLGVWTGEWRNAEPRALRMQGLAVLVLVCAVVVLSRASL
jgi:L-rhamnose-H+ transport protein